MGEGRLNPSRLLKSGQIGGERADSLIMVCEMSVLSSL